jgi:hypothetical protein
MARLWRIVGLLLVTVFLFWLWYDAQPKQKIASGLRHGQIGGLTKTESEAFYEALTFVTSGIRREGVPVVLNQPGSAGAIRVLTVTDSGSSDFQCDPGNAAYDPHLDAVLIHVDLVRAWLKPEYEVTELFSPRKSFFIFLLLHELGHRAKHGSLRKMYGAMSSGGDVRLEEEADQFAFDQMQDLAKRSLVIGTGVHSALAEAWKLPPGSYSLFDFNLIADTRPADSPPIDPKLEKDVEKELVARTAKLRSQPMALRRDLFFLSLLHALPRAAMRGDSPYSSLHRDPAHPTLVNRFRALLEHYRATTRNINYLADPDGLYAARVDELAAVQQQIDLLGQMETSFLTEVTVPASIASLTWRDSQLLVLTRDGDLFAMKPGGVLPDGSTSTLATIQFKPADAIVRAAKNAKWSTIQSELWTDADDHIYTSTDSGVFEADRSSWRKVSAGPFAGLQILSLERSIGSPRMAIWTGDLMKISDPVAPSDPVESELIVVANGETVVTRRPIAQLESEVQSHGGPEDLTIDVAAVNGDAIWLSAWSIDERLLGLAAFDPNDLHFLRYMKIRTNRPIAKDSSAVAIADYQHAASIAIAVSGGPFDPKAGVRLDPVEIYTLNDDGSMAKRGTLQVPFSRIVALSSEMPEAPVDDVQFLDQNHLLVNSHSWSPNFLFKLNDGTSKPLFFPSTSLNARNAMGQFAFVPLSGGEASLGSDPGGNYRCYVITVLPN